MQMNPSVNKFSSRVQRCVPAFLIPISLARARLVCQFLILQGAVPDVFGMCRVASIYLSKLVFVMVHVVVGKIRRANSPQLQVLLLIVMQFSNTFMKLRQASNSRHCMLDFW